MTVVISKFACGKIGLAEYSLYFTSRQNTFWRLP